MPTPTLNLGQSPDNDPAEMLRHLDEAILAHAQRNTKKAAAALAAAETAAKKSNLTRQAAKIRKALALLAQGHAPRLLTRPGYLDGPH